MPKKSGRKASDVAALKPKNHKQGWVRGGKVGHYNAPGMPLRWSSKKGS